MHPKMLLLGLCTLGLLCLSAQAIFESLCIILDNLSLCNSFTSRYGFVFKSVLPGTDVAYVCIIPFLRLLITASWDCIGTGFHMHGIYFSVIHFDNFNLTVLQASFLSYSTDRTWTCGPPATWLKLLILHMCTSMLGYMVTLYSNPDFPYFHYWVL